VGTRIAVVGAGIAGLTASIALAQRGFSVDLVERSPALEEIGAGIQLSPNATAVLDRLGMLEELGPAMVEPEAIEIFDGTVGKRLASIPLGATARNRYGTPYYLIHRADLQRHLFAAARRHGAIALHLATDAQAVRATADEAILITGGRELATSVVIAADGLNSRIRTGYFGYPPPSPLGRTAWRAAIPIDSAPHSIPLASTGLWLAPRAHLVHYPVAGGANLNVVLIGAEGAAEPPRDVFGRRIGRLIDAVPSWTVWPLAEVDASRSWVRGRVALAGDAAHAMAPTGAQGGAQAIEDAWVLAEALSQLPDVNAALTFYDRTRRRRARPIAFMSRRNLALYGLDGRFASARNLVLRNLPASFLLPSLDWLFGWRPE
jgi:salicylate hydroxylase